MYVYICVCVHTQIYAQIYMQYIYTYIYIYINNTYDNVKNHQNQYLEVFLQPQKTMFSTQCLDVVKQHPSVPQLPSASLTEVRYTSLCPQDFSYLIVK